MNLRPVLFAAVAVSLAACGPSYSPNTYASNAVQQAAKVEQGVVVGVRDVAVTASGTTGTVTGAAAGGITGSQIGVGPVSAFTALGGSLIGGLAGSAAEHTISDTQAFEYIVRKPNGDLISVTQKDATPLKLGQKVLVIAGAQARIVPDYTVAAEPAAKDKPHPAPETAAAPAEPPPKPVEEPLPPPPGAKAVDGAGEPPKADATP